MVSAFYDTLMNYDNPNLLGLMQCSWSFSIDIYEWGPWNGIVEDDENAVTTRRPHENSFLSELFSKLIFDNISNACLVPWG